MGPLECTRGGKTVWGEQAGARWHPPAWPSRGSWLAAAAGMLLAGGSCLLHALNLVLHIPAGGGVHAARVRAWDAWAGPAGTASTSAATPAGRQRARCRRRGGGPGPAGCSHVHLTQALQLLGLGVPVAAAVGLQEGGHLSRGGSWGGGRVGGHLT